MKKDGLCYFYFFRPQLYTPMLEMCFFFVLYLLNHICNVVTSQDTVMKTSFPTLDQKHVSSPVSWPSVAEGQYIFFFCIASLHLPQSHWRVFLISAPVGSQNNKQVCVCRWTLAVVLPQPQALNRVPHPHMQTPTVTKSNRNGGAGS